MLLDEASPLVFLRQGSFNQGGEEGKPAVVAKNKKDVEIALKGSYNKLETFRNISELIHLQCINKSND
ncbi:hypothetical protein JCM10914_6021 [Paenibacillus sp. JCM 10914]|nr:hypothetical protein JCM10914_6021 [Paenibacillus sp. JCM 10914]